MYRKGGLALKGQFSLKRVAQAKVGQRKENFGSQHRGGADAAGLAKEQGEP